MFDDITLALTVVAIAGSGLVADIFFAFSTFVMKALDQVPDAEGIRAMQRINVTVINPWFMLVFLGTPAVCMYLFIKAIIDIDSAGSNYVLAGASLHIVGSLLVTIAFNVPRNNALEKIDPDADGSRQTWSKYVRQWTMWNHVRTVAPLGSTVLLTLAVLWR